MGLFIGVMVALALMYAFGFGMGLLAAECKRKRSEPHVWLFGDPCCINCGKTMEECGIKTTDASQYVKVTNA